MKEVFEKNFIFFYFFFRDAFGKQKSLAFFKAKLFGALEGIRTPDLLVRSQTLYPTELPAHILFHTLAERLIIISRHASHVNPFFNFFLFSCAAVHCQGFFLYVILK